MPISIIIPTLNEAQTIVSCILSIRRQSEAAEIIVVDGGSTDETVKAAQPYASVITSLRGRAAQMNAGARRATGDALLFLHADSHLPLDALPALEQALDGSQVVGGTFMLRFDHPHVLLRLIAFFTWFRFRYFHYGDQGVFVRRSVFWQLGGFKDIPLMEDVDFIQRLRQVGRVALIRRPVTTSARRFLQNGIVRQQLLNISLVICYLLGANPWTLAKWYQRTRQRLGSHSPDVAGQTRG